MTQSRTGQKLIQSLAVPSLHQAINPDNHDYIAVAYTHYQFVATG